MLAKLFEAMAALGPSGKRRGLGLLLGAIVAAAVIFRMYYGGNGLLFGDANFLWSPSLIHAEVSQFFHAWRPAQSGGIPGAIPNASQDYLFLQALLAPLGSALSTVVIFPVLLVVGAAGFYRLTRALRGGTFGAVLAAFFFVGNPWLWDQILAGHVAITIATVLSPWVFYTFVRVLRGETAFGYLLLAACALELACDPRITMFVFAGLWVAAAAALLTPGLRAEPRARRALVISCVAAPLFALCVNAWWTGIYAFVRSGNLVPFFYPPLEDTISYSAFGDLWHTLVLSGYFIHFSWQRMAAFGWIWFALWYASGIAVLAVALGCSPKSRMAVKLSIAAVVIGLLLSMGSQAIPLSLLYWLYTHVPFMSLLREPIKFGFVAAFGIALLLGLLPRTASKLGRTAIFAAVTLFAFPIFTGWLAVPDGHGFQDFSERGHYVAVLNFLKSRPGGKDFRIAVMPPWLAEQSLSPGAFYTANPFVFQSEIPVLDAKLINTASLTDNAAWRAFYGMYWGIDRHPAQTLGALGVRYLVVLDTASLSAGAASTLLAQGDAALMHALIDTNHDFAPVYRDGPYEVFENRKFMPLVRTPRLPAIAGEVPSALSEALPAEAFGDAFGALDKTAALPPGAASIESDPVARCFDEHPQYARANAYSFVSHHSDYTGYWVAGDWLLRGAGTYSDRLLQRFAPPYAFTESGNEITVPFESDVKGSVFLQGGTTASEATFSASLDGGAGSDMIVRPDGFHWFKAGEVSPGKHTVRVRGAGVATLLRTIAVAPGSACSARSGETARVAYFIPGPAAVAVVKVGAVRTDVTGGLSAGSLQRIASIATPPGAAAFKWDFSPAISGTLIHTMTGLHRLTFLSPSGPQLGDSWKFSSDAPYQTNAASHASGATVSLGGGRWPQEASLAVNRLTAGQDTLAQFTLSGTMPGLQILVAFPGAQVMYFNSSDLRAGYLLVPYLGENYRIVARTPANARGSVTLTAGVRVAVPLGDQQFVQIPAFAVAASSVAPARRETALAEMGLRADGVLGLRSAPTEIFTTVSSGSMLRLQLRGLGASEPTHLVIRTTYDFASSQSTVKTASIGVGTTKSDRSILIPVLPLTRRVAITLEIRGNDAGVPALDGATLFSDATAADDGTFVRVPRRQVTGGRAVAADTSNPEKIVFHGVSGNVLVSSTTYDPNWTIDSRPHWIVNSYANGWSVPPSGVIAYGVQPLYARLQLLGALLWLASVAAFVLSYARSRRRDRFDYSIDS